MKNDRTAAVSADAASLEVLRSELRERLALQVRMKEVADEIAKLLRTVKKITREKLAVELARGLATKFPFLERQQLERLIANRPTELGALLESSRWDDYQRATEWILKEPKAKRRARITSEKERIRRTKAAKNWHEHLRRSYVTTPGWIERDFAERPHSVLLGPYDSLPPTGPCLDDVFHGGAIQMCNGIYSLQSLFGLGRKKLAAAGKGRRRGREIFYRWRAVLRCMVALLKQTDPAAPWLPDATRRRIVLTGILLRARQEATPEIGEAFAKQLGPYLN
jgi:hypothetical protein